MLSNLTVKSKLIFLLATAMLSLVIVAGIGLISLKTDSEHLNEVGNNRLPSVLGLEMINEAQTGLRSGERLAMTLESNQDHLKEGVSTVLNATKEDWSHVDQGLKIYEPLPQSAEEAALWKDFQQAWDTWKNADSKFMQQVNALDQTVNDASTSKSEVENHANKRRQLFDEMRRQNAELLPLYSKAEDLLNQVTDLNVKSGNDAVKTSEASAAGSRILMLTVSVVAIIVLLALGIFTLVSTLRQLGGEPNYVVDVVQKIAAGDMTVNIITRSGDDSSMLVAIKNMAEKLSQIIAEVRSSADSLSSASEELSSTAQTLSQATTEQAASVEETSASIEEMSASIAQNTENAKVTDGMATQASKQATEGGEAVKQTVSAMRQIAGKIGIIDDIAYQTNLLALNAAIEAARAGEHGKGFAVVAAEVRKLAERSQVAAQEIGEVASSSVELAERAGKLLDDMVPAINKTSDLVQEITAASEEQSSGVGQINAAMNQVNQITQQNASSSEELAATAEEMSGQAALLQQLVAFFKVGNADRPMQVSKKPTSNSKARKSPVVTQSMGDLPESEAEFVKF